MSKKHAYITNEKQKEWLVKVSQQIPKRMSLIPKEKSYRQYLSHYQQQINQIGVCKLHGLRHAYAQRRYEEITKQLDPWRKGLSCPISGGKSHKELNSTEKVIDRKAREMISRELGHSFEYNKNLLRIAFISTEEVASDPK